MGIRIEHLDNKALTPVEHASAVKQSIMESLSNQEHGIYREVTLDLDDLWMLLENVKTLQKDIDFYKSRQKVNGEITDELVSLNDERVKNILTKLRLA